MILTEKYPILSYANNKQLLIVRSSRLNFLIVSDVSATYTAAIIKDVLQLQKNLQL
jgi:hypothetical protein